MVNRISKSTWRVKMNIIIIDQNDLERILTIKALKKIGYNGRIEQFADIAELLTKRSVCHGAPDGVIIDGNRPLAYSAPLMTKIKRQPELHGSALILYAIQGSVADIKKCIDSGADMYIAKAISWKDHCTCVDSIVQFIKKHQCQ